LKLLLSSLPGPKFFAAFGRAHMDEGDAGDAVAIGEACAKSAVPTASAELKKRA
jgi:hypothetical protein